MTIPTAIPNHPRGLRPGLHEIAAASGSDRLSNPAFARAHYIECAEGIQCSVAIDGAGGVIGFQSLILATEGNPYGTPPGWGIIGTHIRPAAHRRGVGTALFSASRRAAARAGLRHIDAYILAAKPGAQAFYDALGFRTYRQTVDIVQKVFAMKPAA